MGEIERVDSLAMEMIADSLENVASEILLTSINWPDSQQDSPATSLDLHAESARLWTESVVDRLEVWAKRARRISVALERQQLRRLT